VFWVMGVIVGAFDDAEIVHVEGMRVYDGR
jgi:hypothetical protein